MSRSKQFVLAYILISIFHLYGEWYGLSDLLVWTKPLLMPLLILSVFSHKSYGSAKAIHYLILGLSLSWLGDVLLLLEREWSQPLYFYFGLGGFLLAQLAYIRSFLFLGYLGNKKYLGIIYGLYLIYFLWLLFPGMTLDLKIPVGLYGLSLAMMAWQSWRTRSMKFFLGLSGVLGSTLFLISDSLLAINKFKNPISMAGFWIMITYIVAQYLIAASVQKKVESGMV